MSVFGVILVRIFSHLDSISLRIQSECGKIRTRITPNTSTFYEVINITKSIVSRGSAYIYCRNP